MSSLLLRLPILLLCFFAAVNGQTSAVEEATIDEIRRQFAANTLTSRQLVDFYIDRIKSLNPVLRSVIELNPDAADQAETADQERRSNGAVTNLGKLHGIPVLIKDTIATRDKMNTTAGSFSLVGAVAARDAGVVERLRLAGAVILGKTSLSEWYKFRSMAHIPNGWCARAGQGVNPYYPSGDPCGSSSGSAISVAANMATVSLGTETHSSIICPSDHNSVVGIKPTVGLTSRAGVIPVMPSRDTIGPIARTVVDAVYLLDVISGFDPRDEVTCEASKYIPEGGYKQFLNPHGLKGKRLGVVRHPFLDMLNESVASAFEDHLNTLRGKGAIIVDNLEIANISIIMNPGKSGEFTLMMAEFKLSLNEYLKALASSPVRSLADVIAFNKNNPDLEKMEEYGQDTFIAAEKTNGIGEKERKAIESMKKLSRDGFEKTINEHNLDAILTPGSGVVSALAIGGFPGITVPAGYDRNGMPFGMCFSGLLGTEPKLIEIAYGFELATKARRLPFVRTACELTAESLFRAV